jgi:hypothetical protein
MRNGITKQMKSNVVSYEILGYTERKYMKKGESCDESS